MSSTSSHPRLERYRQIIPDWDRFMAASHSPEPVAIRVRRALIDSGDLRTRLAGRGFELEPVAGLRDYLKIISGPDSVAQTLEHWLGFFHVQQAVMALPPLALAPAPGERVLDLCAAPGGKTVHLSELMGGVGPVVAVDPKEKRLRGLMSNVFRLGCSNILVVAADGRELPQGASFDRVLVDAPCSAEGNYRRQEGRLPARTSAFQRYITQLQESLLRRAIELTRPGGSVVYSTCTFAPEENEGVVDRVLADTPVELEEIPLELPHAPGLGHWDGRAYLHDLSRTWRVYPHHLDSGGLYMARLRKTAPDDERSHGGASHDLLQPAGPERGRGRGSDPLEGPPDRSLAESPGWSPIPPAYPGESEEAARVRIQTVVELLETEYGFDPATLTRLGWMSRKENLWVQTAGHWPLEAWEDTGGWRLVSAGLRAFRSAGGGKETPTNQFLTRFRDALNWTPPENPSTQPPHRRKELDREELDSLLEGNPLQDPTLPAGPVVLYHEGILLGRGMVGRGGLRHEIPDHQARRLQAILQATGS